MSSSRNCASGYCKRKKRWIPQSQRGDIHNFFIANTGASKNPNDKLAIVAAQVD
jgi:hypothetical protein